MGTPWAAAAGWGWVAWPLWVLGWFSSSLEDTHGHYRHSCSVGRRKMRLWELAVQQAGQKLYLSPRTFGVPSQKTFLPRAKCSLPYFLCFSFFHPTCFSSPLPIPSLAQHTASSARAARWLARPEPRPRQRNTGGSRSCKTVRAAALRHLSCRAGGAVRSPGTSRSTGCRVLERLSSAGGAWGW